MAPNPKASADQQGYEWSISDLLAMKSDGKELNDDQIAFLVRAICDKSIDDCQLGALLMSVKLRGMTDKETVTLTRCMRDSGTVMSWPEDWLVADKHSTGGVGDKVSLALAPAVASLGLRVPMISGRGLEHTGGTLDKLESIPGYRVSLSEREMFEAMKEAGCCIMGQTLDIVPADRRMYAARDVTATVKSTPLIVSSIVSKKAAESVGALVIDVKFGRGAFMKTREEAQQLAEKLVTAAKGMGMKASALLTTMDAPVGRTVGNALEVQEAIDCMRGEGPPDLQELVISLGGELLAGGGVVMSEEEGRSAISRVLTDGSARAVFCKMLQKQGVTQEVAEVLCGDKRDYHHLPQAAHVTRVPAATSGVLVDMDAMALAKVSLALGAGRRRVGDPINYAVGIVLLKVVGDSVQKGEEWIELHHDAPLPDLVLAKTQAALTISPSTQHIKIPSRVVTRVTKGVSVAVGTL